MIDLLLRIRTRARWLTLAQVRNLIDADGNPVAGVDIDEIGPVVITPGDETTPPVIDDWHWVNVRLYGRKEAEDEDAPNSGEEGERFRFFRSKLVKFIRNNSTQRTIRSVRVYEIGSGDNRVQILDPRDVTNPPRVWAGGMEM